MLRAFILRAIVVLAPRAALTMTAAGGAIGWESNIIDLRGQLPASIEREYAQRDEARIEGLVFHHTATKGQSLRSIAEYHQEVRKWPAIAYHYAIGWDGKVYLLNDPDRITYHAQGNNARTISAVLVGNYQEADPTDAMMRSTVQLYDHLTEKWGFRYVALHRDLKATLCPGDKAVPFLSNLCFGTP